MTTQIEEQEIDVDNMRAIFEKLNRDAIAFNARGVEKGSPVRNVRGVDTTWAGVEMADVADGFSIIPRASLVVGSKNSVVAECETGCVRNVRAPDFELVTSKEQFPALAEKILAVGTIALAIETYGPGKRGGLDPWQGEIRLLSLHVDGDDSKPWLIDLQATGYELGSLKHALEKVEVMGHNIKFDALWLLAKCEVHPRSLYCTLTAARLLCAGEEPRPSLSLDLVVQRYLAAEFGEDLSCSDWGSPLLLPDQHAYAAKDVVMLHELRRALDTAIAQAEMTAVADLEMKLLPAVVDMEASGIPVDVARLEKLLVVATADAERHKMAFREAVGDPEINPRSTKTALAKLQELGVPVECTSEEALSEHKARPEVEALLAFRVAEKGEQQLVKLREAARGDGRVHCRFNPTGTDTGRFTSSEPNMQNLGRGDLRTCVAATEGKWLVIADYSQIELRAAAVLTKEDAMMEAYKKGVDLHRKTAAAVLGKAMEQISKEDRQLAKAVNFGLLFGQTTEGLMRYAKQSYGVSMTMKQAEHYRTNFFRTYPALATWHSNARKMAGDTRVTEARARGGRRRLLPASAKTMWWKRFATLVNMPVQGACADGLKRAMIELKNTLPPGARMVNTVHDELIIECDAEQAEQVCKVLSGTMESAMRQIFPEIPIEVEASCCRTWAEKV